MDSGFRCALVKRGGISNSLRSGLQYKCLSYRNDLARGRTFRLINSLKSQRARSANKMGRDKYIGKWVEPESRVIDLPFTVDSARVVLSAGLDPNSRISHQDIAHWCERFWKLYRDVDAPREIEQIMPILAGVETQWDLFIANTYKLEELQKLDFGSVRLPHEWFEDWIKRMNAELSARPNDSPAAGSPSGHEATRVTGSRQLRGAAAGIAESFLSRNNDVNGYWAIGKLLRLFLRGSLDGIRLDLMAGTLLPDKRAYRDMCRSYSALFQKQLKALRIPTERVQSATLFIKYDQQLPLRLNSARDTHRCVCRVEIQSRLGRCYSAERTTTCARHNIFRERRSLRRTAHP